MDRKVNTERLTTAWPVTVIFYLLQIASFFISVHLTGAIIGDNANEVYFFPTAFFFFYGIYNCSLMIVALLDYHAQPDSFQFGTGSRAFYLPRFAKSDESYKEMKKNRSFSAKIFQACFFVSKYLCMLGLCALGGYGMSSSHYVNFSPGFFVAIICLILVVYWNTVWTWIFKHLFKNFTIIAVEYKRPIFNHKENQNFPNV